MTLFKKAPIREWDSFHKEYLAKASKRVAQLNSDDLLLWSDSAASGLMRTIEDYLTHHEVASLEEMGEAVVTLQAVVMILRERFALTYED